MQHVFDTEELTPQERLEAWQELTSRMLMPMVVTTDHAADFRASLEAIDLGAEGVSTLTYSSLRSQRTPKLIRQSDPELYTVGLIQGAQQGIRQGGHEAISDSGDLVVYSSSMPFDAWVATNDLAASVVAQIPRAMVPIPQEKVDRLLAVPLPGREGLGDVLARFLTHLATDADLQRSAGHLHLGDILVDLLTALLAHHLQTDDSMPPEPRRRVLFLQIQRFIQRHLTDPDLSPSTVAAANHISTRYLHQLFHQHGRTVSAWIRQQRLERCRTDLANPERQLTPVKELAARWGFTQPAVFSRIFRASYGLPPREYRHQALAGLHAHDQ